ncbi:hypothetical protein P691DRAFT_786829 [Macrolepiota fuliginosa MF-IS2]|uniref:Uncharacterized protein n=1 Tax=Macrolepiota fuliginosa MF-IS2 TaxID=1400762 RepID=A0A9P6BV77_9AGAR|nr:hypothetical protein P691DRAFT_786829 [Macrolepiota fuliginosa MF-IS2]
MYNGARSEGSSSRVTNGVCKTERKRTKGGNIPHHQTTFTNHAVPPYASSSSPISYLAPPYCPTATLPFLPCPFPVLVGLITPVGPNKGLTPLPVFIGDIGNGVAMAIVGGGDTNMAWA